MKSSLNELKEKLKKDKIEILNEDYSQIIPILVLETDKMPGRALKIDRRVAWQRKEFYDFTPFFIKDHDGNKAGSGLSQLQELINEADVWKKNNDIPIAPKIALLKHIKTGKYYPVEKFYERFNQEEWKKNGLIDRMEDIQNKLSTKYEIDYKPDNFVYDKENDQLLLVDICVVKEKCDDKHVANS